MKEKRAMVKQSQVDTETNREKNMHIHFIEFFNFHASMRNIENKKKTVETFEKQNYKQIKMLGAVNQFVF